MMWDCAAAAADGASSEEVAFISYTIRNSTITLPFLKIKKQMGPAFTEKLTNVTFRPAV